ncbi:uncharacterized protein BO97DRAFT_47123 [Aspergillus homomorphus CBS 101889]|uniref:Uncharacterized protein n=1 Tax=Aspergillus homomorphus (strain CBS 101889) TaxID=1450537 RepID=A0A395I130_ASPHC|nr:hypothetical protein BO97DRAFT_47123 [Aspergillus homomorphus CBS 101889]RAL12858.1 hypothetical protein BO97DRAFT_47123 [Aspergillus homomorphus CBS 101889]
MMPLWVMILPSPANNNRQRLPSAGNSLFRLTGPGPPSACHGITPRRQQPSPGGRQPECADLHVSTPLGLGPGAPSRSI